MTSHGHSRGRKVTPTYRSFTSMWTRCSNPQATRYAFYGARGISVCSRWKSFENFLADVGEKPSPSHSLDRIDNNGNYEPGNVRWVTHREQCRNRRSNTAVIRDDGLRFSSIAEAIEATDAYGSGISSVLRGKQKTHRGHSWSYA